MNELDRRLARLERVFLVVLWCLILSAACQIVVVVLTIAERL